MNHKTTVENSSIDDFRNRFSKLLGLTYSVPEQTFLSVLNDPLYAHHILTCRNTPELLEYLLLNPPMARQEPPSITAEHLAAELVSRAAKAIWKWRKSGFATVDAETFRLRFDACIQCPHLVEAPSRLLYRLVISENEDKRICNRCGCVAIKKAKLPSESCPDAHPVKPGYNRWGEHIED